VRAVTGCRARDAAQERDLAEALAAAERTEGRAFDGDLELAVGDDVEEIPGLAFAHELLVRRGLDGPELAGERLELRRPERRKERDRAEQRELDDRDVRAPVDREQAGPDEQECDRENRPDPDHRGSPARESDEQRREERAHGKRGHTEPLEQPEDAAEEVDRRDPLQQRPAGDVDDDPAGSRHSEQRERRRHARVGTDDRERHAPREGAGRERRGQEPPADERRGRPDPDHPARAECRVEIPSARPAEVEQRGGEDDEHDVERPDRDGLRGQQPEQQPRLGLPPNERDGLERRRSARRGGRPLDRKNHEATESGEPGHHGEHDSR
jgi:hypothetical protein